MEINYDRSKIRRVPSQGEEIIIICITLRQRILMDPKLDARISFLFLRPLSPVTLRGPPLDSETGWTEELWSKRVLLILEN